MKERVIISILLPVICLNLVAAQIGLANSTRLPGCQPTSTACGYSPSIHVTPALPTINHVISITASGMWYDTCIPAYQSHEIISNTIRVNAVVTAFPSLRSALVTPWSFTFEVGLLPAGSYQADLYISYVPGQINALNACASKVFHVFEQVLNNFLPLIAK